MSKRLPTTIFPSVVMCLLLLAPRAGARAQSGSSLHIDVIGPNGSDQFGRNLTLLGNGNFVVVDPGYDASDAADVGAAYVVSGATGAILSQLVGSSAGDQVGSGGVLALPGGNALVASPFWDRANVVDAGALTWINGQTGLDGVVSASNSLVGSTALDHIGTSWIQDDGLTLTNGNVLVFNGDWDNGSAVDAGAITWIASDAGIAGAVGPGNSLVGSTTGDHVGERSFNVALLPNGNAVIISREWDNGMTPDGGAATWINGATGIVGPIGPGNSLVGSHEGDFYWAQTIVLANGNFIVINPEWDNGGAVNAGAVTWGDSTLGISGPINAVNSLVGSTTDDQIGRRDGLYGVRAAGIPLESGDYVVHSPNWSNGSAGDAGALTWIDGMNGLTGAVGPANSLVGSSAGDRVGALPIVELPNGNYVAGSPDWDNGAIIDAGAVTWLAANTVTAGAVSSANSLVGSTSGDRVGGGVNQRPVAVVLTNGDYAVQTPTWDRSGIVDAGAITWGDAATGVTGPVTTSNRLVGTSAEDHVGTLSCAARHHRLTMTPDWDNGLVPDVGAVTWIDETNPPVGPVTAGNSLIGWLPDDSVGDEVTCLSAGDFLVSSPYWDNGVTANVGAVSWVNDSVGLVGVVGPSNSLVGTSAWDFGGQVIIPLRNGNALISNSEWDAPGAPNAGAITWINGATGLTGEVSVSNSLVGDIPEGRIGTFAHLEGRSSSVQRMNHTDNVLIWSYAFSVLTWMDGATGLTGTISSLNSLTGLPAIPQSSYWALELADGNYVVAAPNWDDGSATDVGAVTWGDGRVGVRGTVNATNSLVGTTAYDRVGAQITLTADGANYLVSSPAWDNGSVVDAGAVTFGNGASGIIGPVDPSNSLIGTSANDRLSELCFGPIAVDGFVAITSCLWDNGALANAGAVTIFNADAATTTGAVTQDNSVLGQTPIGTLISVYDDVNGQFVVSRYRENIVTLYRVVAWPPISDAGDDLVVKAGELVSLSGEASVDTGAHLPLTFQWAQIAGPQAMLNDPASMTPTFIAPAQGGRLIFKLTVTNAAGVSDPTPDVLEVWVAPGAIHLPIIGR